MKAEKHYVIKTHRGHKVIIAMISLIVFIVGVMFGRELTSIEVNEEQFRTVVVGLLLVLNLSLILLILIVSNYMIEVKDSRIEEEDVLNKYLKKSTKNY